MRSVFGCPGPGFTKAASRRNLAERRSPRPFRRRSKTRPCALSPCHACAGGGARAIRPDLTPTRQENNIRDHGGDIDTAQARYGGTDWIDLSTGINRVPYPLPALPVDVWTALPTAAATARLLTAAGTAYRSQAPMLAVAGAQAAIQLIPPTFRASARAHPWLPPTTNTAPHFAAPAGRSKR